MEFHEGDTAWAPVFACEVFGSDVDSVYDKGVHESAFRYFCYVNGGRDGHAPCFQYDIFGVRLVQVGQDG